MVKKTYLQCLQRMDQLPCALQHLASTVELTRTIICLLKNKSRCYICHRPLYHPPNIHHQRRSDSWVCIDKITVRLQSDLILQSPRWPIRLCGVMHTNSCQVFHQELRCMVQSWIFIWPMNGTRWLLRSTPVGSPHFTCIKQSSAKYSQTV